MYNLQQKEIVFPKGYKNKYKGGMKAITYCINLYTIIGNFSVDYVEQEEESARFNNNKN